jgi:hypothetical protein
LEQQKWRIHVEGIRKGKMRGRHDQGDREVGMQEGDLGGTKRMRKEGL